MMRPVRIVCTVNTSKQNTQIELLTPNGKTLPKNIEFYFKKKKRSIDDDGDGVDEVILIHDGDGDSPQVKSKPRRSSENVLECSRKSRSVPAR